MIIQVCQYTCHSHCCLFLCIIFTDHPKLLDLVYERNIQNPSMIHHLWKYRPAVTLEYLSQQIDARELTDTYPALSFFLREVIIYITNNSFLSFI